MGAPVVAGMDLVADREQRDLFAADLGDRLMFLIQLLQ
jgi:hypothetical protein